MEGKQNYVYYSILLVILLIIILLKQIDENTSYILIMLTLIGQIINSGLYNIYKKLEKND